VGDLNNRQEQQKQPGRRLTRTYTPSQNQTTVPAKKYYNINVRGRQRSKVVKHPPDQPTTATKHPPERSPTKKHLPEQSDDKVSTSEERGGKAPAN
jgi:hypothetical protein